MTTTGITRSALLGIVLSTTAVAIAEPMQYEIDPNHTYPTFEADHLGGVSLWRGKINSTSGTISLDVENGTGSVDITMDMDTIDYGHDDMNEHAKSAEIFDVAQFPTATYTGELQGFADGKPTSVDGTLTLHGVSRPVTLSIDRFLCKQHPMQGREVCGADATAEIDRSEFGVDYGKGLFNMGVTLRISVEALAPE